MSAPLPHLSTADLTPYVEAINRLADHGWELTISHVGSQWEVAFCHVDDRWLEAIISARSRLLGHALRQAIDEADSQPVPS